MARRKFSAKRSRARMKLDWVVNEDTYGSTALNTLPSGGITAQPLTYPKFMFRDDFSGFGLSRDQSAFPEGEKQFVKAVRGEIGLTPSVWSAGATMFLHLRITKKPMDFGSGGAITDALYSMEDYVFANERYSWQKTIFDTFVAGSEARTVVQVRAAINQWLEPDEALFLFIQNLSSATVTMTIRPWLRTLMRADS